MHITEGIITGAPAVAYTAAAVTAMAWGTTRMNKFVVKHPDKRPLLGMCGALIFFISLIPIPAFTGTCTHPAGTPLAAILLGPGIGIALTGLSLLLQAAFFAHGGFGTWGANVINLGVLGCLGGWGVFRLGRRMGLPLWAAGMAGGLVGDLLVYAGAGFILAGALVQGPTPQFSFGGYLAAIYAAYLPTQVPIAIGEMVLTGAALHYAFLKRPEVLADLGVVDSLPPIHSGTTAKAAAIVLAVFLLWPTAAMAGQEAASGQGLAGMDEAVNEQMAEQAGLKVRDPLIDTESMGDLWNTLLLLAGGLCGFTVGRWWHLLWGNRTNEVPRGKRSASSPAATEEKMA